MTTSSAARMMAGRREGAREGTKGRGVIERLVGQIVRSSHRAVLASGYVVTNADTGSHLPIGLVPERTI